MTPSRTYKSLKREIDRVMTYTYENDCNPIFSRMTLVHMIDQEWLSDRISTVERGKLLAEVAAS